MSTTEYAEAFFTKRLQELFDQDKGSCVEKILAHFGGLCILKWSLSKLLLLGE